VNALNKSVSIDHIDLSYLPNTDVCMANFIPGNGEMMKRNAVAAMVGTLLQSIVEQKILSKEQVLEIYCKAVTPD